MITLFSRVANHRCPRCDTLQSQFALRTTIKGGLQIARLNTSLTCAQCGASLRMVPPPDGPGLFVWQALGPVLFGVAYLSGFALIAQQFRVQDGLLATALALFVYFLAFALAVALVSARLERFVFKLEVL